MISISNLLFRYNPEDRPVLASLSLDIQDAEYLGVTGPNGCGKTTLIKQMNALLVPTEGTVQVDGMDTRDPAVQREIRRRVGMVFQDPDSQIVGMTVEEDIAFGPGNLRFPPAEIRQRVDMALAATGIASLAMRAPYTLSGGEKRLVAVAGILAMKPHYIAFDEPTAYLDHTSKQRILEIIRGLPDQGIGVIHVTHDINDIIDADRVAVMGNGSIVLQGRPREIFCNVASLRELGLPIPPVVELMHKLAESGWDLSTDILTIDEARDEINNRQAEKLLQPARQRMGRRV